MSHACEKFINCQKRFTSEYQPTPKAKKAGWENRRARKLFFDQVLFSKVGGQNVLDGVKKKIAKLLLKESLTSEEAAAFSKTMEFFKTFTPDLLDVSVKDKTNYIIEITPDEAFIWRWILNSQTSRKSYH